MTDAIIPTLNDFVREAYNAQEAFDNWDQGRTWNHTSPGLYPEGRYCTLQEVVDELDAANRALVDFVLERQHVWQDIWARIDAENVR